MRNQFVQIYDTVFVKLTRGAWAKVDVASVPLIQDARWYAKTGHRTLYAVSDTRKKGERMHRAIVGGPSDHINNNGLDNRLSNLRPCSTRENGFNKRLRSDNSSGFKGVSRTANRKAWRAYIVVDRKQVWLGTFNTACKAHEAYCQAAAQYHGPFANLGEAS